MRQTTIAAHTTIGLVLLFSSTACVHPADPCGTEEELVVQWEEQGPDGTAPEEAVENFEGEYQATGTVIEDDSTLEFTIGLERRGETVDYDVRDVPDSDIHCPDAMDLPLTLTLHTPDGTFEEELQPEILNTETGSSEERLLVEHIFPADELVGTWEPAAPQGYEVENILVTVRFNDDAATGDIRVDSVHGTQRERQEVIRIGE